MRVRCFALLAALMVPAAHTSASFVINYNLGSTANGFYRWDVFAINTGGATGTQIKALEFTFRSWSSTAPAFEVDDWTDAAGTGDPDGIADTVNLLSTYRTRIRVSNIAANNVYVGFTPTVGPVQPNPYAGNVTQFHGAIANLGTTQATGLGFQIARIFMPAPVRSPFNGFDFYGYLGGDKGPKVPFSIHSAASIAISPADVFVDFPAGAGTSVPFLVSVSVNSVYGAFGTLSLSAVNVPGGVTIESITGGAANFAVFTIQGSVDRSLIGTTRVVELEARSSEGGYGTGYFMLVTTPEPDALLGVLGGAALCRRRSRN